MTAIPQNYSEWEHCITIDCDIPLTLDYVTNRIEALQNDKDYHTQKFVKTWGEAHRAQTLV